MTVWLVEALASSTLLLLVVLAARRPVARAFGARAAYALWLLPALRMALPALPGHRAWFMPVLRLDPAAGPIEVGLVPPADAARVALPLDLPPPPGPAWDWATWLLAVWAAGAVLWFGWQIVRYRRFIAEALRGAALLGVECGVEVWLSDGVAGPVAAGIVRRRILLPRDFTARYDAAERRQALLHEGAHHDRHDLLANLAALGFVALHWWNPLAHLAHRLFRADQELACDATVLAQADGATRYAYGRALVKSSGARTPAAACALDNATAVKRRLRAIGRGGVALPLRALGALLAAGAIGGGLVATASGQTPPAVVAPPPPLAVTPPPAPALPPVAPAPRRLRLTRAPAASPALPAMPAAPARPVRPALDPIQAGPSDHDMRELHRELARVARDSARLRRDAERERERALAEAARSVTSAGDGRRIALASLEATRARMAADCAARGRPVAAGERDWGELALCGRQAFHDDLRRRIAAARWRPDEAR